MEVVYAIIIIIAALSLYEYFSAVHWQQVTSSYRNDIVFEKRNKAYGAYVLRKQYDKRMLYIIGGLILFLGVGIGVYKFVMNQPVEEEKVEVMDLTQFTIEPTKEEEELPPPPPEPEIPPAERTIAFVEPQIVDHEVDNVIPPNESLNDEHISNETNDVEDNFNHNIEETQKVEVVETKAPEILTFVEEPASFPGGVAAMHKFIQEHINVPQVAVENGYGGKCYLKFVVSPDGSISNVTIMKGVPDCPECDNEAKRVVKSMPPWKPGKNGGKAVYSYFTMPINYDIQ